MTTTVRVVTANIRGNPLQSYFPVRNRVRQAVALAGREGITFLQECDPGNVTKSRVRRYRRRYSDVVLSEARRYHKEVYGRTTETPIVLDSAVWRVDSSRVINVHGGKAHVSPDRDIVQVRVTHRRTGAKLEFDNCHPVSKGHYPATRRGISALGWRISRLALYMRRLASAVSAAQKAGYSVVYGGDMNDPTPQRTSKVQIPLHNAGLDHLFAVPAPKHKISNVRRSSRPATRAMDHPILVAKFTLR